MTTAAILRAVEEVCLGQIGSVRTVASGTLERGAHAGASDARLQIDTLVRARVEVSVVDDDRTGAIGPETANISVDALTLKVRLVFSTAKPVDTGELDPDVRRAIRALATDVANDCRSALAFPGNLVTDSTAAATNLCGGQLLRKGSARVVREDWAKRLYEVEFFMGALVNRVRAVA